MAATAANRLTVKAVWGSVVCEMGGDSKWKEDVTEGRRKGRRRTETWITCSQ